MTGFGPIPAPARADGSPASFALAAWAGDTLYVTGQIGSDESGVLVAGGVAGQTAQAIRNISTILRAVGLDLGDVVKCNVWLVNEQDFEAYDAVYRNAFTEHPPARSTMICGLIKGASIEIEAIAHAGAKTTP